MAWPIARVQAAMPNVNPRGSCAAAITWTRSPHVGSGPPGQHDDTYRLRLARSTDDARERPSPPITTGGTHDTMRSCSLAASEAPAGTPSASRRVVRRVRRPAAARRRLGWRRRAR